MEGFVWAYVPPESKAQREYTRRRVAALQHERKLSIADTNKTSQGSRHLERTTSHGGLGLEDRTRADDHIDDRDTMDRTAAAGSISSSSGDSSHSRESLRSLLQNPYELRNGRRCLRDLPYPLPVDLPEIQRQNLRTLLGTTIFGKPVCSPRVTKSPPQKVLELGCGGGYWSSKCHEYFCTLGHRNAAFTGLDIAPLAPNFKKSGMNWTFVQHDMRRMPLPFEDADFDLIMLKDLSLVITLGNSFQALIDDCIRLLRAGGTLEIWESDHVLRSLLPHPPPPTSKRLSDHETALQTGTFLISPSTPFAPAQNKYLQQANAWVQEALDRRKLPPTPCARIAQVMYQEPESLADVGIRRVAIPLGELRWERSTSDIPNSHSRTKSFGFGGDLKGKGHDGLTPDQAALRQTALLTVVQMIESLEPLLKEVCGKNSEEWSHWWASMMGELMDPGAAFSGPGGRPVLSGECLEVGAWWATKIEGD